MGTENALVVQWLRLRASATRGMGLMPVWGTEIPQAVPPGSHHALSPVTRRRFDARWAGTGHPSVGSVPLPAAISARSTPSIPPPALGMFN